VGKYVCSHYNVISKQSQGKDGQNLQASFHYTLFINVYEIVNISSVKKMLQLSVKILHGMSKKLDHYCGEKYGHSSSGLNI
jgi:hypothetical protein